MEYEFNRQIEVVADQSIELTHLDNHRPEIYFYPDLYKICLKLSLKYNIPIRFPFLNLDENDKNNISNKLKINLDIINKLEKTYLDLYYELNIKSPKKVLIDKLSNLNLEKLFKKIISFKGTSKFFPIELGIHLNDSDLENHHFLLSDEYLSLLNDNNIKLANYKNAF